MDGEKRESTEVLKEEEEAEAAIRNKWDRE